MLNSVKCVLKMSTYHATHMWYNSWEIQKSNTRNYVDKAKWKMIIQTSKKNTGYILKLFIKAK